jgi:hypothetical protein
MKQRNMASLVLGIFFMIVFVLYITKPSDAFLAYTNLVIAIGFLVRWWFVPKNPIKPN